ncbi:MAG: FAD-binding oxidoreductase [Sphingobium sp.]|nr:FAD-binding oxidoreductase [Sphingobium sp.]
MTATRTTDILIVGGGMAGMSLAAAVSGRARVTLIEQEAQPGYHATGRSVAFWTESYGGPGVQPLTSASGPLLAAPDPAFWDRPFLSPRGAVHIGQAANASLVKAMEAEFAPAGLVLTPLTSEALRAVLPGLRTDWSVGLAEPSCTDIDVAALLQAFQRGAQRRGAALELSTRFLSARRDGDGWRVQTDMGEINCGMIVNAAGAWADPIARASGLAPLGISPLRRTVVQLRSSDAPEDFPLVIDLNGQFYFKPAGAGRIWLSPHDETPAAPGDVAPEEMDVAVAIDRFEAVVDWRVEAVERKWAGLRSFAPDRLPVYGFDPRAPGFFWFAGQGGFGMQTAPAAALVGAALLLGETLPVPVAGIDITAYAPDRLLTVGA